MTGCSTAISTANSQCLFGVTGKKIRRFPVNTGVTSLGVCLRNQTVEKTTTEFMKAIGYQGILDIGYRYDRRDGQYKVLDVNPRIGCTFRLFTATNGMDVARALYLDMTGQPVPPAQAADGRKWIVEDFDLFSAIRSWRDGTLKLNDWVSSFRGVEEAACFALDDPLPFLMMGVADCCELYRWFRCQMATRQPAAAERDRHHLRNPGQPVNRLPWSRRFRLPTMSSTASRGSFLRRVLFRIRRVIPAANLGDVYGRFRPLHIQVFQRAGDDLRYRQIAEPFVVRGNHKPRRVPRAGLVEHILEGLDVVGPSAPAPGSRLR